MKKSVIRSLPTNCQGKDYVVGDLHGCFDLLQRVLNEVDFDKTCDRLFSVGDLIDRGPNSLKCLELLSEPWFYAVKGNHEDLMLEFFQSYRRDGHLDDLKDVNHTRFLWYGGSWIERYFQADKRCMTSAFDRGLALAEDLPMILVVGEGQNRFHVIHSDLIRRGGRKDESPVWLDSDIDYWLAEDAIPASVEDSLLYSRSLMSSDRVRQGNARFQAGLSPTFCGHTYASRPRQTLSHVCLDTGAFVSMENFDDDDVDADFGLTVMDVYGATWISASYSRDHLVRGKLTIFNTAKSV
jgi:serine/threonine protein phosphatase 1